MPEPHNLTPHDPMPHPELLRQVMRSSVLGTVLVNMLQPHQPIVYVNPAFERQSGYTAAEVLGRNCRFLQGADRDQPGILEIRHAIQTGQSVTVTLRNYRKDSTLFHNELALSPVRDDAGALTHFIGFQNDVTARENASLHSTQAQQRLVSTLERVTDGFIALDWALNFTYVNAAAARLSARRPEDLTGLNLLATFPEFTDSAAIQAIHRAQETGRSQTAMSYLVPLDTWIDITVYPAQDGLSVFIRDVTEQHQMQEKLRVSEERFSKVFQASPMPMFITRLSDQRLIDLNDEFLRQFGYARAEVIGRSTPEVGLWSNPAERAQVVDVITAGEQVRGHEVRMRTRSGEDRDMVISLVTMALDGESCVVSLLRDVTSEKQAQRMLVEKLREAALTDPLTRLGNRRALEEALASGLNEAWETGSGLSLISLDLDGLKAVNDRDGHERGDALLVGFAESLRLAFRGEDALFRIGGDEFVVLVKHPAPGGPAVGGSLSRVRVAVDRLRRNGFDQADVSAGIATFPLDSRDAEGLLRVSDQRMYLQKQEHRTGRERGA